MDAAEKRNLNSPFKVTLKLILAHKLLLFPEFSTNLKCCTKIGQFPVHSLKTHLLTKIKASWSNYFHHFWPKYHRRHITMKSIEWTIYESLLYDEFQRVIRFFIHWSKPMGRRVITIPYVWVLHLINFRHNPPIWYDNLLAFRRSLSILGFYSTQE